MPREAAAFRVCTRCKGMFPREQVYSTAHCRTCEPIRRREYLAAHPEQREKTRRQSLAWARVHDAERRARLTAGSDAARTQREADRRARRLYRMRDAAAQLGVTYNTLASQAKKGVIATVREGRLRYVHEDEIARYRREHSRRRDTGHASGQKMRA